MNDLIPLDHIEVTVRGRLPGAGEYLRRRVHEALVHTPQPVLAARATMARHDDPAVAERISASANVDLNGRIIHVDVDGATVAAAADHLHDCLRRSLERATRHGRAHQANRKQATSAAGEHRAIVRHRSYSRAPVAVADAVADLNALGYEFHLFTDAGTGQDCVLYRTADGYRLGQVDSPRPAPPDGPVTLSPHPAARLSLAEAQERFDLEGRRFLFFADAATNRGAVLYQRDDGELGLVTAD